jgi:PHP family Zn ribbon phosphoesterase
MGTYRYDLHIHSALSPCADGEMTPNNIARMCMLGGVDIAALTDHNSTANCPAFFKACEAAGVMPVAGCEVNTSEEIHALCLFPALDRAMEFGGYLRPHVPDIENDAAIFGRQTLMDENDAEIGSEHRLLIAATDISIDDLPGICAAHGGACLPAHIDRPAFSLLCSFGFIPDTLPFRSYEISSPDAAADLVRAHPALRGKTLVCDSDAHTLEQLVRTPGSIDIPELSAAALVNALK